MPEKERDLGGTEEGAVENMYLTFLVAQETYAVNIGCVTEIVGMQPISQIPDVPAYIKGAMNLRGKVIPVMDQRLRFGLAERAYDERTTIIVLDLEGVSTGLVVDQVTDVLTISKEDIDPPPHWLGQGQRNTIRGLGKLDGRVSIILDVPQLVLDESIQMDLTESPDKAHAGSGTGRLDG
jgi:purine-binding chemotaxis protein CheW